MTQIKHCPDCGKIVSGNLACSCGWLVEANKESQLGNYRCYYRELGEQCRNEGTICRTVRSDEGQWFCLEHWYQQA